MIREEALWWIRVAKKDLERARYSLEKSDKAASLFWSQQAVEKALKALHIALTGDAPKTHNIKRLCESIKQLLDLDESVLEKAYELTQYYFITRYPDLVEGLPDEIISYNTAKEGLLVAERIVKAAEKTLGKTVG